MMKRPLAILGCTIVVLGMLPHEAAGQIVMLYDSLPSVSISTDKSSYDQFEPILAILEVTNETARDQEYGPLRWSADEFNFGIRLVEPDGDTAGGFALYGLTEFLGTDTYTFGPGESRADTFNLLFLGPVWSETGHFSLEVYARPDPLDFEFWVDVASASFSVVAPTGPDSLTIALLSEAVTGTLNLLPWGLPPAPDYESVLDSLATAAGTTADMKEFAKYIHALYADIDFFEGGRDSTDAAQRYSSFLTMYPNTVYRTAVEQGYPGLRALAGSRSYSYQRDTIDELYVKVFLEGAFTGGAMSTTLKSSSQVPTSQPYAAEPWSYSKPTMLLPETPHVTDWVLVSILDTTATPDTLIKQTAEVVDEQGNVSVELRNFIRGNYYVVVEHRNHIPVMSDTAVVMTGGFAEHDFTTGHAFAKPNGTAQKQKIIAGPDTVYAMFAADGNVDGQITAPDFNLWIAATTAGATGYEPSDYNMDGQATAPDFNLWNANTTAGAQHQLPDSVWALIRPTVSSLIESQSLTGGPGSYVRLNVTKDSGNAFWVRIEARADTSLSPNDTFGSATIDVNYDDTELTPSSVQAGVLGTGYSVSVAAIDDENGAYIRLKVTSSGIGTEFWQVPGYSLDTDWEVLQEIRFTRTPPPGDDGTSIRLGSLSIGFYDSPSNENGSGEILRSHPGVE